MEMGNRYGINMGNILSTASNIKTARLNREIKQRTLDKDKAKERNTLSKIQKGQAKYEDEADDTTIEEESQNAMVSKSKPMKKEDTTEDKASPMQIESVEEDTEVVMPPEVTQNALNANKNVFGQEMEMPQLSEQEMSDYALDSESYDKMVAKVEGAKLVQRQYEQKLATLQMTMPDITPQQRQELAKASVADLKTFSDMIVKADDKSRKIAKETLNIQARQLFSVSQLPAEGSARKDAYTQWRNNQIQAVPKDKQQKMMDTIPEWDNNTMNWIGEKLASVEDTFKTINDIEAKKVEAENKKKAATTKHLREQSKVITQGDKDIKLTPTKNGWKEDSKTSNALLKEQEKNKGGSGSIKTSDYSLINKSTWQNFTGYDIDNPDEEKQMAKKYSQSERDLVTKFSADASKLLRTGKAGSPLEAVQMVKDNMTKEELAKIKEIEKKKKDFKETNTDSRFR